MEGGSLTLGMVQRYGGLEHNDALQSVAFGIRDLSARMDGKVESLAASEMRLFTLSPRSEVER